MEEYAKRGDIRAESDKTKNNIMGLWNVGLKFQQPSCCNFSILAR